MTIETKRVEFQKDKLAGTLAFVESNPWKPIWSEDQLRRFLTQFVSNEELVFDLWDGDDRVCLAVLLDTVTNPGNFANLEILGLRSECDPTSVIDKILYLAKKELPLSQSGLQIGFHDSMPWSRELVSKHNLDPYYETFSMWNENFSSFAQLSPEFRLAIVGDDLHVYPVLMDVFKDSPDTSIPQFDDWLASRRSNNDSRTWLAEVNNQIVGFLTLCHDSKKEEAEIRTLGVLPTMQGRGYGRALIRNAFHYLQQNGFSGCELSVSVQNKNALHLYESLGFRSTDHFFVYK